MNWFTTRGLMAVVLASWVSSSPADAAPTAEQPNTIPLAASQMKEFGVEVGTAEPSRIEITVELPGEVRPNQDRLVHIVPRFDGVATSVNSHIGDDVSRGTVLAVIESSESLSPYNVTALMSGTVLARHLTVGESVSTQTEIFTIADLDTVWVDLSVYQSDYTRVRVGASVMISTSVGQASSRGTISYVSPFLDRETRTAIARIAVPNRDRRWKPGSFVTGDVTVESRVAAVAVPPSAVQTMEGTSVVFVREGDAFFRRDIVVGLRDRNNVEVLQGLAAGESYAVRGSFVLKSELEKSAFGE
jgi:membrane fusion protein, heavy metal efflux system